MRNRSWRDLFSPGSGKRTPLSATWRRWGPLSPTQVADLLNRFVTQRIQREAIRNGDDLFKVMANEPPHVKANFLKYAVAMKYADSDMAKDVLRKYGHRFAMQFNFN